MKNNDVNRVRLIYIPDALCSDSYGFAPEILQIREHFKDVAEIEVVNGGFRAYGKGPICEIAPFLKKHWNEIEENTSQKFNNSLLADEDFIVDSEPPARAVIICRLLNPQLELEFFLAVERLVFVEGKNVSTSGAYLEIIKDFDIDPITFTRLFDSESIKLLAKADFEKALGWGIRSFPSLILATGVEHVVIARRYAKAEVLIPKIEGIINNDRSHENS